MLVRPSVVALNEIGSDTVLNSTVRFAILGTFPAAVASGDTSGTAEFWFSFVFVLATGVDGWFCR